MARRATKDTYGVEVVGGAEVRRLVKAGSIIPDQYQVEDGSFEDAPTETTIGIAQHGGNSAEQAATADKEQEKVLEAHRNLAGQPAAAEKKSSGKSSSKGD